MSATLVSSNTTIKVNGAISAGNSLGQSSGTLYTAPAAGYAIVHILKATSTGNLSISLGGRTIYPALTAATTFYNFHVGPSQSVAWSSSTGETSNIIQILGVEFINTP